MHNIKVIMILLLGVTILFTILGSFKMLPVESFKDNVIGCSGEVVPECHQNVLKFADYQNDPNSDYILKTELVVPTSTACPSYSDKEYSSDNKEREKEKEWDNSWEDNKKNKKDWKKKDEYNGWNDSNWDSVGSNYNEKENENNNEHEHNNEDEHNNEQEHNNEYIPPNEIDNSTSNSQNIINNPPPVNSPTQVSSPAPIDPSIINSINEIKGSIAQINQKANPQVDTPPCPACERCPEPAFECKKVPNYRSPSIDNYMPVPVLNNFSNF